MLQNILIKKYTFILAFQQYVFIQEKRKITKYALRRLKGKQKEGIASLHTNNNYKITVHY